MFMPKPSLFIVAAITIAACNEPAADNTIATSASMKDSATFNITAAKSAIEVVNNKFMESIRKGDSAGAASVYSADALVMPANMEAVSGKDLASFWGSFSRMGVKEAKLFTEDVIGNAELLAETGK